VVERGTECRRLGGKEEESDRTPSKEALALVRQDEETGLIPLRKDLVPAASDVPIRWPPVVIIREQASRRPGRRLPWQILVIMAACVLLGAGLALLLLRPFLRQPVAALLPSPTQATLAKTLLTAVATAQPPTSVPTITSIPTPTDTLAPSPTYTPTSTRTPQPTSTPMPWKAVGESWEQDGAVLTLKEVGFFTKEPFWGDEAILVCRLTFTNKTGQDILVQVRFADFKLVDNLGNSYAFADEVENRILLMPRDGSYRGMFRSLMVKPDQDVNWPLAYGPQPNEKPLPTDADYFVLRVEKFSRIPLAGWKIDIPK